jgi:hypothetical protein
MPITARHDTEIDALYVRLGRTPVATSVEAFGLVIDLDSASRPVGVEALQLPVRWHQMVLAGERFGFVDELDAIWAAIQAALPAPESRTRRSGSFISYSWELVQTSLAAGSSGVSTAVRANEYALCGLAASDS